MDRFTYRDNGVPVLRHDLSPVQRLYQSVERLAAYEDTGLTPEEIIAMKAERDAAVQDLNYVMQTTHLCPVCGKDKDCPVHTEGGDTELCFPIWRGPQSPCQEKEVQG